MPLNRSRLRASTRTIARVLIEEAHALPLLGSAIGAVHRRRFNAAAGTDVRLFRGIYPTFAAAARDIPADRSSGYDNEPSAYRLMDEWLTITPYNYANLFWLSRLLPECSTIFDWGGNIGLKYFAYRSYLTYPPGLTWWVNDVPAVVAVGKQVAERERADALRFTTTLDELASADLLFAAGVIHFIEEPFRLLAEAPHLPRHLLLSKVPAYEQPSAVTLHNMGTAFCPYHLFNRAEFVGHIVGLGYRLVDEWTSPDIGCTIPFHPDHSISAYSGFYFTKTDA